MKVATIIQKAEVRQKALAVACSDATFANLSVNQVLHPLDLSIEKNLNNYNIVGCGGRFNSHFNF
jgi:hypothetical protein